MKDKINEPKESIGSSVKSFLVVLVIGIIIVTFIFAGGPLEGFREFVLDIQKEKIKNPDGSISIRSEAQTSQNYQNPNTYVGKVFNTRIRLGQDDAFNREIQQIRYSQYDPSIKLYFAENAFNRTVNKIIGEQNAKKYDFIVSKDWVKNEIAKRYFTDEKTGMANKTAMKKNISTINQLSKDIQQELIFTNFEKDFFSGLPVSKNELIQSQKISETKFSLNYVTVSNQSYDEKDLENYFNSNKDSFKMYKLIRLPFKELKDAETALTEILKDKAKFIEIGNKLKVEDKIISIVYDNDFSFIDDFENDEFKKAVRDTALGDVSKSIVTASIGSVIFMVSEVMSPDLKNERVLGKVKNEYLAKNIQQIEEKNKLKAQEFYNNAKSGNLASAAAKSGLKVETTQPFEFLGFGLPGVGRDSTDDINYFVKIAKSKTGDLLEPYKGTDGFIIAQIKEVKTFSAQDFDSIYETKIQEFSKQKSNDIQTDYYNDQKKKIQIVNNFKWVFNQDFFRNNEE